MEFPAFTELNFNIGLFQFNYIGLFNTGQTLLKQFSGFVIGLILTIGFVKSPSTIHKSNAVCSPTKITTNSPTNLTLMVHAIIVPDPVSHSHQCHVNARCSRVALATFTMVITDADMKNSSIGSNKMYWFSVSIPTSNKRYALATSAATLDSVRSHTVMCDIGTIRAPSVVQNW